MDLQILCFGPLKLFLQREVHLKYQKGSNIDVFYASCIIGMRTTLRYCPGIFYQDIILVDIGILLRVRLVQKSYRTIHCYVSVTHHLLYRELLHLSLVSHVPYYEMWLSLRVLYVWIPLMGHMIHAMRALTQSVSWKPGANSNENRSVNAKLCFYRIDYCESPVEL